MTPTDLALQIFQDCNVERCAFFADLKRQHGDYREAIRNGHDTMSFVWQGLPARFILCLEVGLFRSEYVVIHSLELDADDHVIRIIFKSFVDFECEWDPSYYDVPATAQVKVALLAG